MRISVTVIFFILYFFFNGTATTEIYTLSLPDALPIWVGQLNFQKPDDRKFPCLVLARQVAETGGAAPVVLNAANEVAVNAFCAGRLRFTDIPDLIHCALEDFSNLAVDDVESIIRLDQQVRDILQNRLDTSANSSQQTAAEC